MRFEDIVTLEYIYKAWKDFRIGKEKKKDVQSFSVSDDTGLPIGNLTSQLFANVYMHELDRYVKHSLKQRWYVRYADDFLMLNDSTDELTTTLKDIEFFLRQNLKLHLHPKKIILRKSTWGIDWLGRVLLPGYEVLRPSTRRRMFRRLTNKTVQSYHGLLQGTARHSIDSNILQTLAMIRENDTI